jgi:hypothetical protein
LICTQALDASAAAALALIHPTLFALWDEPAAAAQIFQDAAVHYFLVETAQQTIKRLSLSQPDSHGSYPFYWFKFFYRLPRETPSPRGLAAVHPDL